MDETLQKHFAVFRENTIGNDQTFTSPYGEKKILYADWTASGRAYGPIEKYILQNILPFVANSHSGSTATASRMTEAYAAARKVIRSHVNANEEDVLIFCGSGMTAAVCKLQRILGLKVPETAMKSFLSQQRIEQRPVVFLSHMEHHSNQVSWLETIADVELISAAADGNIDLEALALLLKKYKDRQTKIASVTACSNVTGFITPYQEVAKMVHRYDGLCFVDFACSAPYVSMDMHPAEAGAHLDAIFFSPHKFLGGPGTPGILVFNQKIYANRAPDHPGGGTVTYSNPWGAHAYVESIEEREDGGTPPLLQAIRAAMCVKLKEEMNISCLQQREEQIAGIVFSRFSGMKSIEVLEQRNRHRLCIFSFIVPGVHYNLFVRLLNDRYGVQARGGCSCAGTYGHYLLKVDKERSAQIHQSIHAGDHSVKPGWVRLSFHPMMTDEEVHLVMDAVEQTADRFEIWGLDYRYDPLLNDFIFDGSELNGETSKWFEVGGW